MWLVCLQYVDDYVCSRTKSIFHREEGFLSICLGKSHFIRSTRGHHKVAVGHLRMVDVVKIHAEPRLAVFNQRLRE